MDAMDNMIQKIQKLLSLANSDNEHEAKIATSKASELLTKYNLTMQTVKDKQFEYGDMVGATTGNFKQHQQYIVNIMVDYFFVRCIISRIHSGWHDSGRISYERQVKLVGTEANCQIAAYVFAYLNEIYPKLWLTYRDDPKNRHLKLRKRDRPSYFKGVTEGIMAVLKATRMKVENEFGLVVKEDPALNKYVDDITKGRTQENSRKHYHNPLAYNAGIQDGINVKLRKPITATPEFNGKMLGEGKTK